MDRPTKTFGLKSPPDLLYKLAYDVERLSAGGWSRDVKYAAFDCAIDSWHLVDWTLHSVSDDRHVDLCGVKRRQKGIPQGFISRNSDRIPHLSHCHQIATTSKHLVLTMRDDPNLRADAMVRFMPPFSASAPHEWKDMKIVPLAYVEIDGKRHEAAAFFLEVQQGWAQFLFDEGLMRDIDPEAQNVFA